MTVKMKHVLLVDEDPAVARALSLVLESLGCKVLFATTVGKAIHTLAEWGEEITLVVLDVDSCHHGQTLLAAIEAYRENLPVVLLTPVGHHKACTSAARRAAATTLLKPVSPCEWEFTLAQLDQSRPSLASPDRLRIAA